MQQKEPLPKEQSPSSPPLPYGEGGRGGEAVPSSSPLPYGEGGRGGEAWFALKTRNVFKVEHHLRDKVDLLFLPTETKHTVDGRRIIRPIIPGVVFIMTTRDNALRLEQLSHNPLLSQIPPFRIYRYEGEQDIAPIRPRDIALLRLLTAQDASRCEIFEKKDFKKGQLVRVTGGIFKGQQGFVQRVKKNRHVVVQIEGLCAILLPYIHPDLLQPLPLPPTPSP